MSGGTKATISADKTLNGRNLKAGEFTFKLATRPTTGDGTVLQTKTNNADGTIPFDALSYRTSVNAAGNGVILSEAVQAGYAVKSTNNDGKQFTPSATESPKRRGIWEAYPTRIHSSTST